MNVKRPSAHKPPSTPPRAYPQPITDPNEALEGGTPIMTHNPSELPPVEQWPMLAAPDCLTCQRPTDVAWIGPATMADGAEANVWRCRACPADFSIPAVRWPVLDGPDCPHCLTEVTCWAALAPDTLGDLWTCEHGHEFVLTPEGRIILPEDAA